MELEYSRKSINDMAEVIVRLVGHIFLCCGYCFLTLFVIVTFCNLFKGNIKYFFQGIVVVIIAYGVAWIGGVIIKLTEKNHGNQQKRKKTSNKVRPIKISP